MFGAKALPRLACLGLTLVAACGGPAPPRQCMGGAPSALVQAAARVRVDLYVAGTPCDGSLVVANGAAPQLSRYFAAGEPIVLDVAPGRHTVALFAFPDATGSMPSAVGCADADLSPGQKVCLDLAVTEAPDGFVVDDDGRVCPPGFGDCNGSPADGCETDLAAAGKKLCGGACIPIESCCTNDDCVTPPLAGCYETPGTCPGAGGACSYARVPGSQICGTTCCNPSNASCDPSCTATCAPGWFDCNSNPADGCEANFTSTPAACGGCGRACSNDHAQTLSCDNGVCNSTCVTGYANCSRPAAPAADDGCECEGNGCCSGACQTKHSNGLGQFFFDCAAAGTYDVTQATAAANAATGIMGTIETFTCYQAQDTMSMLCKVTRNSNNKITACTCWSYAETGTFYDARVGFVTTVSSNYCPCPSDSDMPWN